MAVDLLALPNAREFTWRDGERLVVFRGRALEGTLEFLRGLGWERFALLTTQRALNEAPLDLAQAATMVHHVPPGRVPDASASIIDEVTAPSLVALGGGRVIDVAKAIAAVRGGRVAAIPTTLSGAEMTGIHRLPTGHEAPSLVRPEVVLADPDAMTDLDEPRLRATAMNALAHGAEALYGPGANPAATLAALRGAELIAASLDQPREDRDRAALALGALLSAHAVDSAGLGYHHAASQELVRVMGLPHADTNATLLGHTMEAMRARYPTALDALARVLGVTPDELGPRLEQLGGGPRSLAGVGADPAHVEAAVDAIRARVANAPIPDPPDRDEIRALIDAAW